MEQYKSIFRLDGKVALITGSTKGIGRGIAEAMAVQGARVVVSSRKADKCDEVAAAIRDCGGEALALPCNISDDNQIAALVAQTLETWGRIDILVCNAAVNPFYGPLQDLPDDAYEKTMASNVRANLRLAQLTLPQMAENGGGSMLIVSSIAGIKGTDTIGIYGISKAADMAIARNLAVEWGPKNIRVNALAPAIIRTDFARALWDNPEIYNAAIKHYPLRRIGDVEDVAGSAVFLASDAGKFITGQTIVIDGGSTISSPA